MNNGEIASVLLCSSYTKVMFVPLMMIDSIVKIWGVHGGDYEECRLLGYKNPVHTSQETHYVSATESIQLMLCKIWGIRGSDYEECRLLWCGHIVAVVRTELLLVTLFLARRFVPPCWWMQCLPPKRRFSQEPRGITSQKTPVFVFSGCIQSRSS
jgi:hypothetical protein